MVVGLWHHAAALLLEAIVGYRSMQPAEDKKGTARSLRVLSESLRYIPLWEFMQFKETYHLSGDNPLLEGYYASLEASWLVRFNTIFLARAQVLSLWFKYLHFINCCKNIDYLDTLLFYVSNQKPTALIQNRLLKQVRYVFFQ